jgi:hypothetical protein
LADLLHRLAPGHVHRTSTPLTRSENREKRGARARLFLCGQSALAEKQSTLAGRSEYSGRRPKRFPSTLRSHGAPSQRARFREAVRSGGPGRALWGFLESALGRDFSRVSGLRAGCGFSHRLEPGIFISFRKRWVCRVTRSRSSLAWTDLPRVRRVVFLFFPFLFLHSALALLASCSPRPTRDGSGKRAVAAGRNSAFLLFFSPRSSPWPNASMGLARTWALRWPPRGRSAHAVAAESVASLPRSCVCFFF